MPRYECRIPSKNLVKSGSMVAPKIYNDLDRWFRKVVKLVGPSIDGYQYEGNIVTSRTIIFELRHPRSQDRGVIIIDRTPR